MFNFNNVISQITNASIKEIGLVMLVGVAIGYVVAKLNLPIPAPSVIAGVIGIFALWLGYSLGVK